MKDVPGRLFEVLIFEVCQRPYALKLAEVQEVVRAVAVSPLPKAPPVIEGIINFRGTLVPVYDLRARLGLPAKPLDPGDQFILARAAGRVVAIRADHVLDIQSLDPTRVEDTKKVLPESDYVSGVAKTPGGLILIHDLSSFLSGAEAEELDRVLT